MGKTYPGTTSIPHRQPSLFLLQTERTFYLWMWPPRQKAALSTHDTTSVPHRRRRWWDGPIWRFIFSCFSSIKASYRGEVQLSRCTPRKIGPTQSPKICHVPPHTIWNIRSPSFQLKIRIDFNGTLIDAHALLDSGAKGIYCNTSFIEKHLIPTHAIDHPIYPFNMDGTINKNGVMRHAAILRMGMRIDQDHWETVEAAITNLGQSEIILGTD